MRSNCCRTCRRRSRQPSIVWTRHRHSPTFLPALSIYRLARKQDLLETFAGTQLLDKLLGILAKRIQVLQLSKEIGEQTQNTLSSQQREHILREQLRQIQQELGDDDVKSTKLKKHAERIEKAGM